jgi:hypothetical protein
METRRGVFRTMMMCAARVAFAESVARSRAGKQLRCSVARVWFASSCAGGESATARKRKRGSEAYSTRVGDCGWVGEARARRTRTRGARRARNTQRAGTRKQPERTAHAHTHSCCTRPIGSMCGMLCARARGGIRFTHSRSLAVRRAFARLTHVRGLSLLRSSSSSAFSSRLASLFRVFCVACVRSRAAV